MGRIRKYIPIVIVSVAAACSTADEQKHPSAGGDRLYVESQRVLVCYIDSMKNAPDTAAVRRYTEELEDSLTRINMRYPSLTDTLLTDEQQLRLYALSDKFLKLKHSKLRQTTVPADSLAEK